MKHTSLFKQTLVLIICVISLDTHATSGEFLLSNTNWLNAIDSWCSGEVAPEQAPYLVFTGLSLSAAAGLFSSKVEEDSLPCCLGALAVVGLGIVFLGSGLYLGLKDTPFYEFSVLFYPLLVSSTMMFMSISFVVSEKLIKKLQGKKLLKQNN